ncbi:MAG: class I SAM-dependent methyltransferase [Chloroflexi bacterium]|nr:class I SAM-dependent methyltransferase [Chloroflexota bacterium]
MLNLSRAGSINSPDSLRGIHPWLEYWNAENIWTDSALWRKQMEVFVRLSDGIMHYSASDKVLDYGCGSGNFAELIADRAGEVVCADVSEHYVAICKAKFAHARNVRVTRVAPDLRDLSALGTGFTAVNCLSVVQYFSHLGDVAAFVQGMQKACAPGARLLIADVTANRRGLKYGLRTAAFLLREGMFLQAATMFGKMWLFDSTYRKMRKGGATHLDIPEGYFASLAQELGARATYLPQQLTLHADHQNVLIEF